MLVWFLSRRVLLLRFLISLSLKRLVCFVSRRVRLFYINKRLRIFVAQVVLLLLIFFRFLSLRALRFLFTLAYERYGFLAININGKISVFIWFLVGLLYCLLSFLGDRAFIKVFKKIRIIRLIIEIQWLYRSGFFQVRWHPWILLLNQLDHLISWLRSRVLSASFILRHRS